MKRWLSVACVIAFVVPSVGLAQSGTEDSHDLNDRESKQFRLCRIAVIVAANNPKQTTFPEESVSAMRNQVEFLLAESAFHTPPKSVQEGVERVRDIETWILQFGKDIRSSVDTMGSAETLDATLMQCQQPLWAATRQVIDRLIVWRTRGMNPENTSD